MDRNLHGLASNLSAFSGFEELRKNWILVFRYLAVYKQKGDLNRRWLESTPFSSLRIEIIGGMPILFHM